MIIDSYCEHLMQMHGEDVVVVLPGGLTPDQYLSKVNILISELFAPLTEYAEKDYRSGKAALMLLKKYCFSRKTYGNAPTDEPFNNYSNATLKMIDEEIKRLEAEYNGAIPVVDANKLFTIIYNTLQLMTSVSEHHAKKKEEKTTKQKAKFVGVELPIMVDVQKTIRWEREDLQIVDVIPYLDKTFEITESFEKTSKNPYAPSKNISEWAEFKYLSIILELSRIKAKELGVA